MTRSVGYLVTALASLGLGTLVYLLERPASALPSYAYDSLPELLSLAAGWLPSLTHAFAFALLTALVLGLSRRAVGFSCALWLGLEFIFEVGQHPAAWDLLERTGLGLSYFRYGTFDPLDLVGSSVGVALVFVLLRFRKGEQDA